MKHQKIWINLLPNLLILVTILFLSTTWTIADEVEDESEFDYLKGSKKGPSHWGELKKEWATCKNGIMQSPIDLSSKIVKVVPKLGELKKNYKPQNAIIRNRGHDIQLRWKGDAGSININGTEFFLRQIHWHSPSEHTINGQRFDMELHMVHESLKICGKSKIAVVGLLHKIGGPDPLLTKLSNYIETIEHTGAERSVGVIDPSEIKFDGQKYYRYMGSLTVPPCDEDVLWTINKEIRSVSKEQLEILEDAVPDHAEMNARPVQLLNGREIQLYG
ncbi:carbonic anhydrase Nec1-like [Vicia villosa]|uniref:carbonic anhydrase Nec1-like n=1 Tax=Vicia villosa TaxID=3911 RepID=UPI00273BC235|nr:carbonic anhydrase Nec1-like [Vicia villosa]